MARPGHQQARRAGLAKTANAVLWSFFGARKRAHYEADSRDLNPLHVILMGVVAAALFVLALLAIIKYVVLR